MGNLNRELLDRFKKHTDHEPIYDKDGMTMHTLEYVNYLEDLVAHKSLDEISGISLKKIAALDPEWIVKQYKDRPDKDSLKEFSDALKNVGVIREASYVLYRILMTAIKDTKETL